MYWWSSEAATFDGSSGLFGSFGRDLLWAGGSGCECAVIEGLGGRKVWTALPIWVLSCRPQWSQKRTASGNVVLQKGQFGKSQNPQRLQNLASARFSVWQLEQWWVFMNLRTANISDFPLPESGSNCHDMLVSPAHNFAQSGSQNKPCGSLNRVYLLSFWWILNSGEFQPKSVWLFVHANSMEGISCFLKYIYSTPDRIQFLYLYFILCLGSFFKVGKTNSSVR
jgi:hypothetical protein